MTDMESNEWTGKNVFVVSSFSNRRYSGVVISQDTDSLTIRTKVGTLVKLKFSEINLLQEEK